MKNFAAQLRSEIARIEKDVTDRSRKLDLLKSALLHYESINGTQITSLPLVLAASNSNNMRKQFFVSVARALSISKTREVRITPEKVT